MDGEKREQTYRYTGAIVGWTEPSARTEYCGKKRIFRDGIWHVELSSGEYALVCECHYTRMVAETQWGASGNGYAVGGNPNFSSGMLMHRLVNDTPFEDVTDHINGNRLDNRCCNLRSVRQHINTANSRPKTPPPHGYRGIRPRPNGQWEAHLKVKGRRLYFGSHDRPEDAARARDKAAIKHFGKHTYLNFPLEGPREYPPILERNPELTPDELRDIELAQKLSDVAHSCCENGEMRHDVGLRLLAVVQGRTYEPMRIPKHVQPAELNSAQLN